MKPFPKLRVPFKRLYDILHGAVEANLLLAAIDLKIFTLLVEPRSAADVARELDLHPDNVRFFLDALAACALLHKKEGVYRNADDCADFLVEGKETYLGGLFALQDQGTNISPLGLVDLVRHGPPPRMADVSFDQMWADMTPPAANYQRAGYAQQIAALISELPEFPRMRRMLDLGGGAGLVGMAIAARHPTMSGKLFEQPMVADVGRRFIAEYGMSARYEAIGGDYIREDIGGGYDLIWAGATLNFAKDCLDDVIGKILRALEPGGVFVSFHEALSEERTQPKGILFDMLGERLTNRDWSSDQGWVAQAMLRAGFHSVHSRTIEATIGTMGLDVGRKRHER